MLNIKYQGSDKVEIHGTNGISHNSYKGKPIIPIEFLNKNNKWTRTDLILDTGASYICMNTSMAQSIGIDINSKNSTPGYIRIGNGDKIECNIIHDVVATIRPFGAILTSVCISWRIPDDMKLVGREFLSNFGVVFVKQKTCIFFERDVSD